MMSAPVRCLMPARKRSSMTNPATATPPKRSLTVRIGSAPRRRSRPFIGQGGGAADLVRRLSDEGNEPRAELIRGPELCRRVTAGDHFEIAVIYGEEIEVGEPCERLDDLRDCALVACVDCVPEVGYLRDQLRD